MKKKPLNGYARKGKRFIPPMKQITGMREQSYIDDLLPELIWLGLIHDRMGYRFGADLLETIIELSKNWLKSGAPINYAMQIAYGGLSEEQKAEIVNEWRKREWLDDIQHALAPLVLLYDGFAMAFVGPPPSVITREGLILRIKECVKKHIDKYETPGVVLCGSLLLTRLMAGTITFARDIELPDLNAVVERPGSEEAKRAASFMRASAMTEMAMLDPPKYWPRYFWNRGAELSPCELAEGVQ
ncbi:MAG: hypothetical protein HRF44_00245 [Ignavibacterium sp.]